MAKNSSWPVTGLFSMGPLKDLKDFKLILNESKLFPWWSKISSIPLRILRVNGQGLFLAVSYRKPALIKGCRTSLENTNLDALFESHFSLGFTFLLCRFINVSYVMEFLAWWVLKSKVFAQKLTSVKWNCCTLWIDIALCTSKVQNLTGSILTIKNQSKLLKMVFYMI